LELKENMRLKQQEYALHIQSIKNKHTKYDIKDYIPMETLIAERFKQEKYLAELSKHQEKMKQQKFPLGTPEAKYEFELNIVQAAYNAHLELVSKQAEQDRLTAVADSVFRYRALEDKHRALQVVFKAARDREDEDAAHPDTAVHARRRVAALIEEATRHDKELNAAKEELAQMEEVILLLEGMLDSYESVAQRVQGGVAGAGPGVAAGLSGPAALQLHQQMQEAMQRVSELGAGGSGTKAAEEAAAMVAAATESAVIARRAAAIKLAHGAAEARARAKAIASFAAITPNAITLTMEPAAGDPNTFHTKRGTSARTRLQLLNSKKGKVFPPPQQSLLAAAGNSIMR
jgi:hypothetical protein